MSVVFQGALAPEAYVLDITPGISGVDLVDVSAAVLKVLKPNNTEVNWSAAMSNKTSITLTLTHSFQAGDLDLTGLYRIYAALTIPGGTVRTEPRELVVKPKYGP